MSEIKIYTVKAEVSFTIKATSIRQAYKEFENLMVKIFNDSYPPKGDGTVIPSRYEGLAIERVTDGG